MDRIFIFEKIKKKLSIAHGQGFCFLSDNETYSTFFSLQNLAHCGKVAEKEGKEAVVKDVLTIEDLLYAFQETRPSVSKGELQKYKRM